MCPTPRALALAALWTTGIAAAWADPPAVDHVPSILTDLQSASEHDQVHELAAHLARRGVSEIPKLAAHLGRPRASTDEERRSALSTFSAAVPDLNGRFRTPRRKTDAQRKKEDELDWLAELSSLPASVSGRSDLIVDVAIIRALAASNDADAAATILDFAFSDVGLTYRDECGRYLRAMAPFSVPALILASQERKKSPSKARYANYQLERLDRQNPHKALAAADAYLKVRILRAFAESRYREAIYATLDHVDHSDPRVRRAARKAWVDYATNRPPREPPKRKLVMTGGKLSEEEEPLWLDHRQLQDIELRRLLQSLTAKAPPPSASLAKMTEELYDYYDRKRNAVLESQFGTGLEHATANRWSQAAAEFDRVLAQDPEFPKRGQMVDSYFALGEELRGAQDWHAASTAFATAHALDPEGSRAADALASHHFCRAKLQESRTGEAGAELARAKELEQVAAGSTSKRRQWMLYAGLVWLAAGLLLLMLGIRLRTRGS